TAFLNGSMEEEQKVYIHQPPGYKLADHERLVCELKKGIYGLKQAPKIWYGVLHRFFTGLGFVRCNKEYCIYVQKVGEHWVIVVVYGDDL
uniref:Reverse transcriptase Ty1/copia-type domain-containing protein n=1 Tax=Phytophthora ramorum TaxID=164328 RepID=H3G4Z7_PHYRM